MARFADVLTIVNGKNQSKVENPNGRYPIYGSGGIMGYADDYLCEADTVVIGRKGSINKPIYVQEPFWNVDTAFGLVADRAVLLPKYLYYFCVHFDFEALNTTVTIPSLTKANLLNIEIQLPSLAEQQAIVDRLSKTDELIGLRKDQLTKLDELVKARFVELFGDPVHNSKRFPVKKLGDLCKVGSSKRIYQNELSSNGVPFLRVSDLNKQIEEGGCTPELFISEAKYDEFMLRGLVPKAGDILVTSRGTLGKCYIVNNDDRFYFQDGMISWLSDMDSNVSSLYISYLFSTAGIQEQIMNLQSGSTVAYLSIAMLKRLDIMLPSILEQEQFSAFVEQTNKSKLTIQASLDKLEVTKKALMQEYFG